MKFIVVLVSLLLTLNGFGQSIVTDRPTQTTGPTSVNKGVFQLETGMQYSKDDGASSGVVQLPINLFRIGLGKGFEIRLVNGISFRKSFSKIEASFSNLQLGFKAQLLNKADKKTQIGFIAHGVTSTGADSWESGMRGGTFALAVNHQLNDKNGISYNLGYELFSFGSLENDFMMRNAFFTLNYSHSMTDKLGIFTEVYGGVTDVDDIDEENMSLNFDAGLTWLLKDNLQLDYSFGFGIVDRMNFHALGLSFYIAPKKK